MEAPLKVKYLSHLHSGILNQVPIVYKNLYVKSSFLRASVDAKSDLESKQKGVVFFASLHELWKNEQSWPQSCTKTDRSPSVNKRIMKRECNFPQREW